MTPQILLPRTTLAAAILLSTLSGCAMLSPNALQTAATTFPDAHDVSESATIRSQSCTDEGCGCQGQIERGEPHEVLDAAGWVFGIPDKLLLWDRRAENHNISADTEAAIHNYLTDHRLTDVKVRLNQYAPGDEWRRLRDNDKVAPGWRYTVGALSVIGYTVIPGRIFGGDSYNPFTNTVNLYSDVPSIAVHEGAYARDNDSREYHGTYGTLQVLPVVNMWHETVATQDALAYIDGQNAPARSREANRILHPLYGSRLGGALGTFLPPSQPLLAIAGAATGHATGRSRNRVQKDNEQMFARRDDQVPTLITASADPESAELEPVESPTADPTIIQASAKLDIMEPVVIHAAAEVETVDNAVLRAAAESETADTSDE